MAPAPFDRAQWERVSRRLDEALELDAAARADWLARLRSEDAPLADELAALLAEHGAAQQERFLEGPGPQLGAAATLRGRRLGAYTLEEPIGQGGMGSVWRARRSDGRYEAAVAVKLLNTALIGAAGIARFTHEGSILGRLQHPNIAHLLDAGVTDDGQPYLVLELVTGETIDAYCRQRSLTVEARLRLFLDVLAAVSHAHAHLIVHRDLKPSNVLVTPAGQVKLLDFGIAKLLADDGDATAATQDGARLLTPQYAAPEQLLGEPITTATDIYTLGAMLYELLAGCHPTAAQGAPPAEVLRAVLEDEPPRLSERTAPHARMPAAEVERIAAERATSAAALRRQLRGDLDNILARTLAKQPQQRYASVEALADDLRRHLAHEPVHARPDALAYRCAKFVRRRRGFVAAALALLLTVSAGLVGTLTQARRAEAEARQAQRERDHAQRKLADAEAIDSFLKLLLTSTADKPFTASELLRRGETLARQQFADDAALRARLQLSLSNLTSELDEMDRTMSLLREARAAAATTGDTALQAAIDCALAQELVGEVDAAKAQAMFDSALRRLEADAGTDRAAYATCLNYRAERALAVRNAKAAVDYSRAAMAALGVPTPAQRTLALTLRMTLAGGLAGTGDLAGSIRELRAGIVELKAIGRAQTVGAATFYNNLGVLLYRAGDPQGALAAYDQSLAVRGGGDTGMVSPALQFNIAQNLLAVGRVQEAAVAFERGRLLAARTGDQRALAFETAGFHYCPPGQAARCERRLVEAHALLSQWAAPTSRMFALLEFTRARMALDRGDLQAARAALERSLALQDAAERHPIRARAAALLARTELALGRPAVAATHAASAVALARELATGLAYSAWLGYALAAQASVQQAAGDNAAARESWREALAMFQPSLGDQAPATIEAKRMLHPTSGG